MRKEKSLINEIKKIRDPKDRIAKALICVADELQKIRSVLKNK